jgi:hypothetical protein
MVTRKRATAAQFTRGAAPDAIAAREGGTWQGYRTEVMAAVPGRTASNAALVTPIWSAMRGSGRGASTGEPELMGCHVLLGVPLRNTSTTVPITTQNVLPLSATVMVSIRIADGFAAPQEYDVVAGADVDADTGAGDGREAVGAVAAGWLAHPVRASALMIAAAAQSGFVRMPVSFPGSDRKAARTSPSSDYFEPLTSCWRPEFPGQGIEMICHLRANRAADLTRGGGPYACLRIGLASGLPV